MFYSLSPLSFLPVLLYVLVVGLVLAALIIGIMVGVRYLSWHPARPSDVSKADWRAKRLE